MIVKNVKNFKLIENIFKRDKDKFWQMVRINKKNRDKILLTTEQSSQENCSKFNSLIDSDDELNNKIKMEFDKNMKELDKLSLENFNINKYELEAILKNLNNGKRSGISGLTNEMLKYGINDNLLNYLKILFEIMFTHLVVPFHFNIAIVKLIIKDNKKPTDNIGNLRPISISDCLSNLLEQICLNASQACNRRQPSL